MTKIGRDPNSILDVERSVDEEADQEDTDTTDDNDEDGIEDFKGCFRSGHIIKWWNQFVTLPSEVRPVFCPTAGFKSTFALLSERAVVAILWGRSNNTLPILESKVCGSVRANELANNMSGELFHLLFIGNRDEIRVDAHKAQTSYGKRTTTMSRVSTNSPATHGLDALKGYVGRWFAYLRQRKEAIALSQPLPTPPALPPPPSAHDQYAISNMLRTDGLQVHMLAFDLRKRRTSSKARVPIMDLMRRFPSQESITQTFHGDHRNTVVVGVDPGEVVSASFCALDPTKPKQATNLLVKRSALYSPVFSYRSTIQEMKQRPGVLEAPSAQELEAMLKSWAEESKEEHQTALNQFHGVLEPLTGFYGSRVMKKLNWERKKASRAEMDWAACGALNMASKDQPSLFVYGNAKFNTHTRLASLHSSFKGHFFIKVHKASSVCFSASLVLIFPAKMLRIVLQL
jgi:hypothetical protein